MRLGRIRVSAGLIFLAGVSGFMAAGVVGTALAQDANTPPPPPSAPVIRAEKRLVLVDTVVMDKKGNYIHDLTAKDFRVWDDNKEQEAVKNSNISLAKCCCISKLSA